MILNYISFGILSTTTESAEGKGSFKDSLRNRLTMLNKSWILPLRLKYNVTDAVIEMGRFPPGVEEVY